MRDIYDFQLVGKDDWDRPLWKSKKTEIVYVEVDGQLYTISTYDDWSEPDCPIGVFVGR